MHRSLKMASKQIGSGDVNSSIHETSRTKSVCFLLFANPPTLTEVGKIGEIFVNPPRPGKKNEKSAALGIDLTSNFSNKLGFSEVVVCFAYHIRLSQGFLH